MQFSPTSCRFISLRSKNSPQQPLFKHPSLCSSFTVRDQVSDHTKLKARENKMTLVTPWKKIMGEGGRSHFSTFLYRLYYRLLFCRSFSVHTVERLIMKNRWQYQEKSRTVDTSAVRRCNLRAYSASLAESGYGG
jgi:hypothetical protein